ncbi:ring-cleaving dioxygenase [Alkalicoccus luteus]|uniref:ring-cleaving dioxygenase n=1 Tax=Alkalicoccus luteus TaxID=1237094 RepID=UPI004033FC38
MRTQGIHHITAIVGHPQENADFYAGVLGLRLVKKTVNFDDPGTYHLYFGNKTGEPGTIITFFPWANAFPGKIGSGQVGVTTYVVPEGALAFWENRLTNLNIHVQKEERFGETFLAFEDPHGLQLEIVARDRGSKSDWETEDISSNEAIKGFGGAILLSSRPEQTGKLLTEGMGLQLIGQDGDYIRYEAPAELGNIIDIKQTPVGSGEMGVGMVHHIAWRAADDAEQIEWQEHIRNLGYGVTDVRDRQYFNAIYFRERGHLLFEIATDPPGFMRDEPIEALGEELKLPEQFEAQREKIEQHVLPFTIPIQKGEKA